MSLRSPHYDLDRQHAVVIGGSMAGLLAARVLSDHFKEVIILERGCLSEQVEPRKGVPQGRHAHLLLLQGELILRELFPDLAWQLATGEDLRYPATEGNRPFGIPFLHWYIRRINELTASDPFVAGRFYQVLHLLKSPATLFELRIVWAMLRRELTLRRQTYPSVPLIDEVDAGETNYRTPTQSVRYTQKELLP